MAGVYKAEQMYRYIATEAAQKGREILQVQKKQIEKNRPKKRLNLHHQKYSQEDYEKIIRYYASGDHISFKDVSKLTGVPL